MTTTQSIRNASPEEMVHILFAVLQWFKHRHLGNPFNYNRAFEFIQARSLGYILTNVGGGSDCKKEEDPSKTGELKATEFKGFGKNGKEKSHSFTYNGTTRKSTIEEQEEYCKDKIMRDEFHYWTLINYENGGLEKTFRIKPADIWTIIWPKWKNSFYNPSAADPRIGGSLSTNDLQKNNIKYDVIAH
jgi:hypothetical protein